MFAIAIKINAIGFSIEIYILAAWSLEKYRSHGKLTNRKNELLERHN